MNDPRTLAADLRDMLPETWPRLHRDAATFIESMVPLHDAWLKAAPLCRTCRGFGGWPSFRCGNPTPHDPHPSIVNTEDGSLPRVGAPLIICSAEREGRRCDLIDHHGGLHMWINAKSPLVVAWGFTNTDDTRPSGIKPSRTSGIRQIGGAR